MTFGNRDFLTNAVLYLADDEGLMSLRQREITLRLINTKRAYAVKPVIQVLSVVLPILLLALTGVIVTVIRRRKYARM